MSGGGGGAPAPRNLYDETSGELKAKVDLAPSMYAAEAQFRPLYQNLDMQGIQSLLLGSQGGAHQENYQDSVPYQAPIRDSLGRLIPGQTQTLYRQVNRTRTINDPASPGLLNLFQQQIGPQADAIASQSQTRQRAADVGDVQTLGPGAVAAFKAANPQEAALVDQLNAQATDELGRGATLDPSLAREVTQGVRQGQAARGMGFGPADLTEEALTRGAAAEQLRRQRQAFASGVVGMDASTGLDPFMAILGRPGQQAGQQFLGAAQSLGRPMGPQLFGSSINANDVFDSNFNQANAQYISGRNNAAATNGAYVQGGAAIAGSVAAIAL